MATAISVANFQTACGNCYDAISADDYAGARKYYAMAEAQNAGLELESESAGFRIKRRESLEKLGKALAIAEESAAGAADSQRRFATTRTNFNR